MNLRPEGSIGSFKPNDGLKCQAWPVLKVFSEESSLGNPKAIK